MRPIDRLNPYINQLQVKPNVQGQKQTAGSFKSTFTQALDQANLGSLKISKHAATRMAERNIKIEPKEWQAISEKVSAAKTMGIKESLVITKNQAMIVSPQNDTVITVLNRGEASAQIFSNIDGAIILE